MYAMLGSTMNTIALSLLSVKDLLDRIIVPLWLVEVLRGWMIIDGFVVDLRRTDSNIFPIRIFRRQLVPNIQMYVCISIDYVGLGGDDVMVSGRAIEVSIRALEDFHGPFAPAFRTTRPEPNAHAS